MSREFCKDLVELKIRRICLPHYTRGAKGLLLTLKDCPLCSIKQVLNNFKRTMLNSNLVNRYKLLKVLQGQSHLNWSIILV